MSTIQTNYPVMNNPVQEPNPPASPPKERETRLPDDIQEGVLYTLDPKSEMALRIKENTAVKQTLRGTKKESTDSDIYCRMFSIPHPIMLYGKQYGGSLAHDFFSLEDTLDRVISSAQSGQKFKNGQFSMKNVSKIDLTFYAQRALEYFGGYNNELSGESTQTLQVEWKHVSDEDMSKLTNQIIDALNELSEQARDGIGTGLSSLTKKVDIQGVEMTLGELSDITKELARITKAVGYQNGTGNVEEFYAGVGLAAAHMRSYVSEKYSAELGEAVVKVLDKRLQSFEQSSGSGYKDQVGYNLWYEYKDNFSPIEGGRGFEARFKKTVDWMMQRHTQYTYSFDHYGISPKEWMIKKQASMKNGIYTIFQNVHPGFDITL